MLIILCESARPKLVDPLFKIILYCILFFAHCKCKYFLYCKDFYIEFITSVHNSLIKY